MKRELFRAKADAIGEEDWIISDSIMWKEDKLYLYDRTFEMWIRCISSTRSVSYPNMIDKNNLPIFASLSEDSVGGDNLRIDGDREYNGRLIYDKLGFKAVWDKGAERFHLPEYVETIGIHKGNTDDKS